MNSNSFTEETLYHIHPFQTFILFSTVEVCLIKDVMAVEIVLYKSTKYILYDNESDYKSTLINLQLIPLYTGIELQDIMFLVKYLQMLLTTLASLTIFHLPLFLLTFNIQGKSHTNDKLISHSGLWDGSFSQS